MSEYIILEKSHLDGLADKVREIQGTTAELNFNELIAGIENNIGVGSTEDISAELVAQDALILQIEEALAGKAGGASLPAIYVTYPEGSTCTCTNGIDSYTAEDTSGVWLLGGLEEGDWTVTATNGTSSKTSTVTLSADNSFASVELGYAYVLFDAADGGLIVPWKAGELSSDATATINNTTLKAVNDTSSSGSRAHIITSSKIDITGYTTLKFNVTARGSNTKIGTCTGIDPFSKTGSNNNAVHYITPVVGENSVPLTSDGTPAASGTYYIFLSAYGTSSQTISANRVWLE